MTWLDFFEWLMKREDRTVTNDPRDQGGMTAWGISRRYHPGWAGWGLVDAGTTSGTAFEALVHGFYWAEYAALWSASPERVRCVLVDTAVNMGQKYAVKCMQQALCKLARADYIETDGVFGPKTQEALKHADPSAVAFAMCAIRMAEYNRRARVDPGKRVFLSGWLNRVTELMEVI